jgi:hypothetical protein
MYHTVCSNPFLNVTIENGSALENVGNTLLIPVQYLLDGKKASLNQDGSWQIKQRFQYNHLFWPKSIASLISFPLSLTLGSAVKSLSLLHKETKERYNSLKNHYHLRNPISNQETYLQMGLSLHSPEEAEVFSSLEYARRPGDEHHMEKTKEGLKEIAKILTEANIPWWVDCGTLLGTYRYGGIIPWDYDIDIAALVIDFENIRRVLNQLDKEKYVVQDWSSRSFPDSFFKIYVKESKDFIDIYFYEIDVEKKELKYIFTLEENIFFFEWWKMDERRFKKPVALNVVFPLKKSFFDGIEVFVPNQPEPFLQRYYGENLAPAKVYNKETNSFEKDLTHPYWQNKYVH